jgi:hypothetical protein
MGGGESTRLAATRRSVHDHGDPVIQRGQEAESRRQAKFVSLLGPGMRAAMGYGTDGGHSRRAGV